MSNWKHPQLGEFEYSHYGGWRNFQEMPFFRSFTYRIKSNTKIPLTFDAYEVDEIPSDEMVDVALKFIANHERVIEEGADS